MATLPLVALVAVVVVGGVVSCSEDGNGSGGDDVGRLVAIPHRTHESCSCFSSLWVHRPVSLQPRGSFLIHVVTVSPLRCRVCSSLVERWLLCVDCCQGLVVCVP